MPRCRYTDADMPLYEMYDISITCQPFTCRRQSVSTIPPAYPILRKQILRNVWPVPTSQASGISALDDKHSTS